MTVEAAIAQHLQAIHQTAASSPAGGGPAWDALLRHYGVAGVSPQERAAVVSGLNLVRGATPGEVRIVIEALVRWANPQLARPLPPTMVDDEVKKYENAIGLVEPGAAPAVSSIFGNALDTSKEVPWANQKFKDVATLSCVHCGAPQQRAGAFICHFCRRPIATR